jgi:hypothetical protein
MPFFSLIYSRNPQPSSRRIKRQQPLQIFFSRAFISASSALIASTYIAGAVFVSGATREAGFDATGVAPLSKQANLAPGSDIDLHSEVCAIAVWLSAQTATRTAKSLISTPLSAGGTRPRIRAFTGEPAIIQSDQSVCRI